jgi:hypothetical protein
MHVGGSVAVLLGANCKCEKEWDGMLERGLESVGGLNWQERMKVWDRYILSSRASLSKWIEG